MPRRLYEGLVEADKHFERKDWELAVETLTELDRQYPNRPEVVGNLASALYELDRIEDYQYALERYTKLEPKRAEALLALATAYGQNNRPLLALRTAQRFLQRWPEHEVASSARNMVAVIEPEVEKLLAEAGLPPGTAGADLAVAHEQMQSALAQGRLAQARQIGADLLKQKPDFIPVYNNLCQAYRLEGRLAEALETARQALALQPDNIHALANLAVFLLLNGQPDEARQAAEKLKASDAPASDRSLKKLEAFSYLGDFSAVLEAFHEAEKSGELDSSTQSPMIYHLAAVAEMEAGREHRARDLWRKAVKLTPGFELALGNLSDMGLPAKDRNGPWAFSFPYWFGLRLADDLRRWLGAATRGQNKQAAVRAATRLLKERPEILTVAPLLFERGDRPSREFLLMIAGLTEQPDLLDAIKTFALSQRGADELRMRAAQQVVDAGLLPAGKNNLWLEGQWREIWLMGFEIHDEPSRGQHSPEASKLMEAGVRATHANDWTRAEALFQQVLALEPETPDAINNLASVYLATGRAAQAELLIQENFERHPDYLFARIQMAVLLIKRGETQRARELLEPLFSLRRLHISEYVSFCMTQIELHLAEKNKDAARGWFEMWEQTEPDDPRLQAYRSRVAKFNLFQNLLGGRA